MKSKLVQNKKKWGKLVSGQELWDSEPVFNLDSVGHKDWLKLMFYPKKFLLYRYIWKDFLRMTENRSISEPYRVLDVGCGTGASVVDLKKMLGRKADVFGVDVVKMQIEIAKEKIRENAVTAQVDWYDGGQLPYSNNSFDAIYSSDVLGHVEDVPFWLSEIARVLRPGGVVAMFCESELGRHAYVRNYLFEKGLNTDPHAEFHISLYSKAELLSIFDEAGIDIEKIYSAFWASFLVHPDEFYEKLGKAQGFFVLKNINRLLHHFKKITHPVITAAGEFYGLVEMLTLGKYLEAQGYVVLGKK